ncbi:hypothetical protein sos41_34740 [Alphaproteobacteria bacterium SO-S41]|nr:hypothetical protein sos41_34740 [Alphaproteobacteria bacterium SO-S41]
MAGHHAIEATPVNRPHGRYTQDVLYAATRPGGGLSGTGITMVWLLRALLTVTLAWPVLGHTAFAEDSEPDVTDEDIEEIDAAAADQSAASPYEIAREKGVKAWTTPPGAKATPEEIDDHVLYVLGNVTNTMFHEFAHGLVSELELPVLGKEEDAVDAFANVVMVNHDDDPALDAMMVAVADDYFTAGQYEDGNSADMQMDEHSMSAQRAFSVICILVGADPEKFKQAADNAGMSPERQASCSADYEQAAGAWDKMLSDHYVKDGEKSTSKITVVYGKPAKGQEAIAKLVKESGIVEAVSEQMIGLIKFPNPIKVKVEACDDDNAFWSPEDRSVTLCYELAQGYLNNSLGIEPDDSGEE